MKSNWIILLVLVFIAFLGCVDNSINSRNDTPPIEKEELPRVENVNPKYIACEADADCINVKSGCCGCANGGTNIAINKNYKEEWLNRDNPDCRNSICQGIYLCKDRDWPQCINRQCQLKQVNYSDKKGQYCETLSDSALQAFCYLDVAIAQNDVTLCDKIPKNTDATRIYMCKYQVAVAAADPSKCNDDIQCISEIAIKTNDIELCHRIEKIPIGSTNPGITFWCLIRIAVQTKNMDTCDEIDKIPNLPNNFNKQVCVDYVNGKMKF